MPRKSLKLHGLAMGVAMLLAMPLLCGAEPVGTQPGRTDVAGTSTESKNNMNKEKPMSNDKERKLNDPGARNTATGPNTFDWVGRTGVPPGDWQSAAMPGTLDLAERARMAVSALTQLDPKASYACCQMFNLNAPGPLQGRNWSCMLKYLRALPRMRAISGSDQNLEVEIQAMRTVLKQIGPDGLLYSPIGADGPPAGTAYPAESGIALQALIAWYERDGNPEWLKWIQTLSDGLRRAAIDKGDYCYIPPECSLTPEGEWRWTLRGNADQPGYLPYTPPAEPVHDTQGQEGCVKFEHAAVIEGLVGAYRLTGDAKALEHAVRLSRFCRKAALWSHDTEDESVPPHEHGIFTGHFHGNTHPLKALLDLAVATDDMPLKQLVREGYEHARRHGVIRLGYVPGWVKPLMGRPKDWCLNMTDACGVADMVRLGVALSLAGLGDYWDDVDSMVRNHFTEQQLTDLERMRKCADWSRHEDTLKGFQGGFGGAYLTSGNWLFGCCTGNGSRALGDVWKAITSFAGKTATVNLLLNRVAPWLDVASHLPHEGLVELRNKQAESVAVRIPGWVAPAAHRLSSGQAVACEVNGRAATPLKAGNYLLFTALKPGDRIVLRFPLNEQTERYTIFGTTYTAVLRGSTVVDISPRPTDSPTRYPLFVRAHLRTDSTPMKEAPRFVAEQP